jgi:hypothetical protein
VTFGYKARAKSDLTGKFIIIRMHIDDVLILFVINDEIDQ